ncbi:MAG: hypothetical protein QMD92_00005, partial [bacterium]|nr:hypothetical protein [bacterium]
SAGGADGKAVGSAVAWNPTDVWVPDAEYDTPSLVAILQAIINRSGWASGQAVMALIKDRASPANACRFPRAVDHIDYTYAAKLIVTYTYTGPRHPRIGSLMQPWRRTSGNYRTGPTSTVHRVLPLGNGVMVYCADKIFYMRAVSSPEPTFGIVPIADFGIPSTWCVEGDDKEHVFISSDKWVWRIRDGEKPERLGYKEYIDAVGGVGNYTKTFSSTVLANAGNWNAGGGFDCNTIVMGHGDPGANGVTNGFVRFPAVTIPAGATITAAFVRFTAYTDKSGVTCDLRCHFNNVDNAVAPTNAAEGNALALTTFVAWDSVGAWTVDLKYNTPSLVTILQTIIDRAGWNSGQAIMVVIKDNASSDLAHREGKSNVYGPAELHVTYTVESGTLVISRNPNFNDYYISNGSTTYLLSSQGLSQWFQYPTSLVWEDANKRLIGPIAASTDLSAYMASDIFDFGVRSIKTVTALEIGSAGQALTANIDYKYKMTEAAFTSSRFKTCNADGTVVPIVSGNEFKFRVKGADYTKFDLDYLTVRYKYVDKRMIRGVYATDAKVLSRPDR